MDAADSDIAAARRTIEDFALTPPGTFAAAGGATADARRVHKARDYYGGGGVRDGELGDHGAGYGGSGGGDDEGDGGGDGSDDEGDGEGGVEDAFEMSEFHGLGTARPPPTPLGAPEWVGVAVEDLAAAAAAAREALKPKDLYAVLGLTRADADADVGRARIGAPAFIVHMQAHSTPTATPSPRSKTKSPVCWIFWMTKPSNIKPLCRLRLTSNGVRSQAIASVKSIVFDSTNFALCLIDASALWPVVSSLGCQPAFSFPKHVLAFRASLCLERAT